MLLFYFGAMNSGKSAYALMTLHQRHQPDSRTHPWAAVLATTLDRAERTVTSRTGMAAQAHQISPGALTAEQFGIADTIVIDEAQFLTPDDVDELARISNAGREVICFGLRTDFTGALFPGSRRLFEVAEVVRQIALEPRCACCDRQAVINARVANGRITTQGPQTLVDRPVGGDDDTPAYRPMCLRCWWAATVV